MLNETIDFKQWFSENFDGPVKIDFARLEKCIGTITTESIQDIAKVFEQNIKDAVELFTKPLELAIRPTIDKRLEVVTDLLTDPQFDLNKALSMVQTVVRRLINTTEVSAVSTFDFSEEESELFVKGVRLFLNYKQMTEASLTSELKQTVLTMSSFDPKIVS